MRIVENETNELKQELTKGIKKEIVAFANTNGGKIYIGVDDNGNVTGLQNVHEDLEALTGMINEGIKPNLIEYSKINIEQYDDRIKL